MFLALPLFSQSKKILIWCTSAEVEELAPIKKIFKKDKKIDVELEIQTEVRSKYIQSSVSGVGPDIVVGAHDWVGELARNGIIGEINLSKEDRAKFLPISLKGFTYNNKLYGVPYCVETLILIYDKRIIKSAPDTWESLFEIAKGLTDKKNQKFGFLYGIDNNFYTNFPFLGSQGAYIFKETDGKYDVTDIGLDNEGAIIGANFIKKIVDNGLVPISTNNASLQTSFLDGKVAIIMDGPWYIPLYRKQFGANLGIAKLPTLNSKPSVPFVGSRGLMLNQASKSISIAREFLNYCATKEGQLKIFEVSGRPPANIEAVKEVESKSDYVSIVIDTAKNGIIMPNVKAMAVVWNYAAGMIDKIKLGDVSVEDALKNGTKTIRDEIVKRKDKLE